MLILNMGNKTVAVGRCGFFNGDADKRLIKAQTNAKKLVDENWLK